MRLSAAERFWAKTKPADDGSGCILWTASTNRDGYGRFWDGVNLTSAHRFAYVLAFDGIPQGTELDHLCRIRNCVNATHLDPVSHHENMRRGKSGDAVRAVYAAKTKCKYGHEFTAENTLIRINGRRSCRACNRRRSNQSYQKKSRNDQGGVG